jgi:hypothetical protein
VFVTDIPWMIVVVTDADFETPFCAIAILETAKHATLEIRLTNRLFDRYCFMRFRSMWVVFRFRGEAVAWAPRFFGLSGRLVY